MDYGFVLIRKIGVLVAVRNLDYFKQGTAWRGGVRGADHFDSGGSRFAFFSWPCWFGCNFAMNVLSEGSQMSNWDRDKKKRVVSQHPPQRSKEHVTLRSQEAWTGYVGTDIQAQMNVGHARGFADHMYFKSRVPIIMSSKMGNTLIGKS